METLDARDLDAAIAVRLFGWRWFRDLKHQYQLVAIWPPERDGWIRSNWCEDWCKDVTGSEDKFERFVDWDCMGCKGEHGRDGVGLPHYSSQWDAMQLVVEEMMNRGFGYVLTDMGSGQTAAFCPVEFESFVATGETLPEAVCRAALKALEGAKRDSKSEGTAATQAPLHSASDPGGAA